MSKKKKITRAEKVRMRRSEWQKDALKDKPVLKPVEPVRPSKKSAFVGPKKRKVKFQRYEANALAPAQDALRPLENPLTMPEIRIEWRALSASLLILLVVSLYLLFTSPYFMVSAPQIEGNRYLPTEAINDVLELQGKPIFTIVPKELERELLLTHPGLADVEISLSLPNLARVSVTERQPALIWQQDGKIAWIDAEGIAFRATAQVDGLVTVTALGPPPAPLVDESARNKLAPPPFIAPETVIALQALLPYIPPGSPIIYDPENGLGWTDSRGWQVEFGDITEDIGLKLRLYETIGQWLEANQIQPALVNLAYPQAPYYRMEP